MPIYGPAKAGILARTHSDVVIILQETLKQAPMKHLATWDAEPLDEHSCKVAFSTLGVSSIFKV